MTKEKTNAIVIVRDNGTAYLQRLAPETASESALTSEEEVIIELYYKLQKSQLKPQEGEREKGSLPANMVIQLLETLTKAHYICKNNQKKEAATAYLLVINAIKREVI